MSVPLIQTSVERLGTSTRKDLHVLCYQHHKEMLLSRVSEPPEGVLYACEEPSCLIRYHAARGYFLDTEDSKTIELEIMPRVSCRNDGQSMYLAQVNPEKSSFRLWKCPECDQSRNNEETSGWVGKKMGA
jgi:hypothetical protein